MDSVTLRKTHFILGDHRSNYSTTLQEQNKYVKPEGIPVVGLNADLKTQFNLILPLVRHSCVEKN